MQLIPYLSCFEISGSDAAGFLDAQLSINVSALKLESRQMACWCNARGQLITPLLVIRSAHNAFVLVLAKSLLEPILRRMSLYIFRSQVTIQSAETLNVIAPLTLNDEPLWQQLQYQNHQPDQQPIMQDGQARDIEDGIAWLNPATSEQFLPQMLAMDYWNAVDYQKGCYPGQEIIARTHYLGRIKRRLYRVKLDLIATDLQPKDGTPIVSKDGSAGLLITLANKQNTTIGLAVLRDDGMDKELSLETNGTQQRLLTIRVIGEL